MKSYRWNYDRDTGKVYPDLPKEQIDIILNSGNTPSVILAADLDLCYNTVIAVRNNYPRNK